MPGCCRPSVSVKWSHRWGVPYIPGGSLASCVDTVHLEANGTVERGCLTASMEMVGAHSVPLDSREEVCKTAQDPRGL